MMRPVSNNSTQQNKEDNSNFTEELHNRKTGVSEKYSKTFENSTFNFSKYLLIGNEFGSKLGHIRFRE